MEDLKTIQRIISEIANLLQTNTPKSKRQAAIKFRTMEAICETNALVLEIGR